MKVASIGPYAYYLKWTSVAWHGWYIKEAGGVPYGTMLASFCIASSASKW